jgi:hypothetical protein
MITETIKLDRCWVSKVKTALHDHHVVPQSCGGANGPTVTLNSDIHNLLHKTAVRMLHEQDISNRAILANIRAHNVTLPKSVDTSRLCYLVRTVIKATKTATVLRGPKFVNFTHEFDLERSQKIAAIAKATGQTKKQVVNAAVDRYSGTVV